MKIFIVKQILLLIILALGFTQDLSLVLYYDFNGNTNDESINEYHADILGTPTITNNLYIDGINALSVPTASVHGLNDFTVIMDIEFDWINSLYDSYQIYSGAIPSSDQQFGLSYSYPTGGWYIAINNYIVFIPDISIKDHLVWHQVTLSRNGNTISLLIDGIEIGTSTSPEWLGSVNLQDGAFIIGQEQDVVGGGFQNDQAFTGWIDNFRIFSTSYETLGCNDPLLVADCTGVCGGDSVLSGCDNGCNSILVEDCTGACGGTAIEDCTGVCNGTAIEDCAGECGGEAVVDCNGDCGGAAVADCMGVCGGSAVADCNGDCGGDSVLDNCGVCGGDTSCYTDLLTFYNPDYWSYEKVFNYNSGQDIASQLVLEDVYSGIDVTWISNSELPFDGTLQFNVNDNYFYTGIVVTHHESYYGIDDFGNYNYNWDGILDRIIDLGGNIIGLSDPMTDGWVPEYRSIIGCVDDCAGICGGEAVVDCNGDCGGSAVEDCTGDCNGLIVNCTPEITFVQDVPSDQGGRVYIAFTGSYYDTDELRSNEFYTIERSDPNPLPDTSSEENIWVNVGMSAAYAQDVYFIEVTTLINNHDEQDGMTAFRVIASMDEGNFLSDEHSGFSIDNISPGMPTNVTSILDDGDIALTWDESTDNDFLKFDIYRDNEFLLSATESNIVDDNLEFSRTYNYIVKSVDINLNESNVSDIQQITTLNQGDINYDGSINIADIIAIVSHIIGDNILSDNQLESADINHNGFVNISDLVIIVGIILGN